MIIITENVEKKLLSLLNRIQKTNNSRRFLHIKTSLLDYADVSSVEEIIHNSIDDTDGMIFMCHDGDIFVVSHGLNLKISQKIREEILLYDFSDFIFCENVISIFEPRISFEKIQSILHNKIRNKKIIEKQIEKQKKEIYKVKQERKRQEIIKFSPDEFILSSISSRRSKRNKTEILIVEDDPFTRHLTQKAVDIGFNVSVATNGQQTLEKYADNPPDVVFLDIGLPDIEGHDVLEKIMEYDPDAYVIMLSGKSSKENLIKAIKNGAKGFVSKPFSKGKLMEYIYKSPHVKSSPTKELFRKNND